MPSLNFHRPTDIPPSLAGDMSKACGAEFAVSYLSGAIVRGTRLTPWTVTGWMRLKASRAALDVIKASGLKLEKPEQFGSPTHPASLRMAAE